MRAGLENLSMALHGMPHATAAVRNESCCAAVSMGNAVAVASMYCLHCLLFLSLASLRLPNQRRMPLS